MNDRQEVRSLEVDDLLPGSEVRYVKLVTREGRDHSIVGKLTNELVIHPDGGIYLRLMLRPSGDA